MKLLFLLKPTFLRDLFIKINQLEILPQRIVDMLRDLGDVIMTSYAEVKEKILFYRY